MNEFKSFLRFRKEIIEFELSAINRYLNNKGWESEKGTSKFEAVQEILRTIHRPIHITEMIQLAEKKYHLQLERDSVVSMLIKKMKAGKGVIRTSPNTFAWKEQDTTGEEHDS